MTAWSPPAEVEEFRLERKLGRGATAEVWLARDTLLDRPVALKIARRVPSAEARVRFLLEARAISRLHHPNLITVHHAGEVDERPFLVTELLSGSSLAELARPVPPERVLAIALDLSRGLQAAHRAGILHRDVKPANAFACASGRTKLIDFGLAKLEGELEVVEAEPVAAEPEAALEDTLETRLATPPTERGVIMGTPPYMAPELWRGESATRSSDVYSLGALLFELLTGTTPNRGGTLRLEGGPLEDLVTRCLAGDPDQRPSTEALRDAFEALAAQAADAGEDARDASAPPYRGLLAFGPEHRALFFGRDAEVGAVLAELRASPFVLVVGASGAGKSSLVGAGVAPRVCAGALTPEHWRAVTMVPGRRPLARLAQAAAPLLEIGEEEVERQLRAWPAWLGQELARRAQRQRTLLVLDQLEEVATLAEPEERRPFAAALAGLLRAGPAVRVVATLRSDFLHRLEELGELKAEALRATVVLGPPSADGLARAIVEPARRRGAEVEPALVGELVAHGARGALPLLSFALGLLWQQRQTTGGRLTAATLAALGGFEGALATHADAVLAQLPPAERDQARRLLLALVTVEGTRARRGPSELGVNDVAARRALDALVEGRLVVAGEGEEGAAYEVAHEALLVGWPTLRGWLADEALARAARDRLERAAAEWERLGGGGDGLYGERQLRDLDALIGRSLGEREQRFVVASRNAARRTRLGRLVFFVGVPAILLAALGLSLALLVGSQRRETAREVGAWLAEAERALGEAEQLDERARATRREAFARYDANDWSGGEARWAETIELGRRVSDKYAEASRAVDLARVRDPASQPVRASAAEIAFRWLQVAERDLEPDLASELRVRLQRVDDGRYGARLAASARLRVSTAPRGATVVLHRVTRGPRYTLDSGHPIRPGESLSLEPGAYLLAASAPGRFSTRYPVELVRGEEEPVEVVLPEASAVPPGHIYVPAGHTRFGEGTRSEATRSALFAQPEHEIAVDAFFMAAHETTFREYLEFLAALSPDERERHRPRGGALLALAFGADRQPVLTLNGLTARRGEPLCRPRRRERRCQDWSRFPVAGISWDDATAYVRWLAATRLPGARLCSEREWERAARGADGRLFAHGDELLPGDANTSETWGDDEALWGIDEVGSYPIDRSPFGIWDLGGNVAEWVADTVEAERPTSRVQRGGFWYNLSFYARAARRRVFAGVRLDGFGLRTCVSAPR